MRPDRGPGEAARHPGRGHELLSAIPGGMVDAGFASLATFAMGFYASTRFEAELLGVYALFFTAFLAAAVIPNQGLFVPAEVIALRFEGMSRLWVVPQAVRAAVLPSAATASLVLLAVVVAPGSTPAATLTGFAVTALVATAISPVQDHVRRSLHIAGVSWRAALVSTVQFAGVIVGLALLTESPLDRSWVPFGALAIANALSLAVGLVAARLGRGPRVDMDLRFGGLAASGRWLAMVGALPTAAAFAVSALVSALAGAALLGAAEAARIVAQPVLVLATGLQAVLGPRSMEAAAAADRVRARATERLFNVLVVAGALVYLPAVGFDAPWNVAADLVPAAYTVGGLVALTIAANLVWGVTIPAFSELVGGRREVQLTRVEAVASAIRVGLGAAAGSLGAYAVPGSLLGLVAVRLVGYRRAQESLYRAPAPR